MSTEGKKTTNGAAVVVHVLQHEKIQFVFGIPGTHNIELYDAFLDAEGITPVLVTDEQSAAFMADGVVRASGALAAVNLVPGAGLTHALSGIAECYYDQIPLLALLCGVRTDTGNAYQLHDIDQVAIARPVCKKVFQPKTHQELYLALGEAAQVARLAPCGPVAIEVSANLYLSQGEWGGGEGVSKVAVQPAAPKIENLAQIAEVLNGAGRVGIYVGKSLENSGSDLLNLSEKLDAVVFTTVSGKGVFPEDHFRFAWNALGRAAPSEVQDLEKQLDCVLAIGCRFAEVATGSYGVAKPKQLIHVDADASVFDRNLKADLKLQADSGEFVRALLASGLLKERTARTVVAARAAPNASESVDGVSPPRLMSRLQELCGDKSVFVTDSGNGLFLAMENLRLKHPRSFLAPVDYSCMGYSVPSAIGAKLACPDRPVVALVGDGAFMMTGFEMATAASYSAGVIFLLLRDRELSQISQFQKMVLGRQICTKTPDYDSEALAKGLGVSYLRLEKDAEIDSVLSQAIEISRSKTPVLVEVKIDYSVSTHFSKGVVKTNFLRLPWKDRLRMVSRVVKRKLFK